MAATDAASLQTIEAVVEAFNRHDIDAILEHFTDDCVWIMASGPAPGGRRCAGKDEIRRVLAERFAVIPDMRWVDCTNWVNGDRAVSEWTVKGTAASGERLDWLGCDLWELRGGLVAKKDTYWKRIDDG